ncbi:MAG: hypothetical protein KDE26_22210 [Bacteroidetes bacterium]|nr:hypothetical protein [Bacteroidota bacterium]MCB0845988.1 hypothetical protein [Bacteroidota bacterium]
MKLSCPTCNQPIGVIHINNQTGLAQCPTCFSSYDPVQVDLEELSPPKLSRIDIYETANGRVEIVFPPKRYFRRILGKLSVGLLMISIIHPFLQDPDVFPFLDTSLKLFTILFSVIAVWSFYSAINDLSESQKLIIDNEKIILSKDYLFFPYRKSFLLDEIIAIKREDKFFFRNRLFFPSVPVIHTSSDQMYLFENANQAEVKWLFLTLNALIEERTGSEVSM